MNSNNPCFKRLRNQLILILLVVAVVAPDIRGQGWNVELVNRIGGVCRAVYVEGKYAYVGQGRSLKILDISNASSPVRVADIVFPGRGAGVTDVFVVGDRAYVAVQGFRAMQDEERSWLQIVDISNPHNPLLLGSYEFICYSFSSLYVAGDVAYLGIDYYVDLVDVSNPQIPTRLGAYGTPSYVWDIFVSDGLAYVANFSAGGLQILDVSNPTLPYLLGSFDTPGYAYGVYVSDGLAYVADADSGLQIIDITNPSSPQLRGSFDTPGTAYGVHVSGGRAYVADYDRGLQVLDVSVPSQPALLGAYDTPGVALKVFLLGDLAFIADYQNGVQVVDVSIPQAPKLHSSYDTPWEAQGVCVCGDLAYIADGASGGLRIFDVSDPLRPTLRGSYDTPGGATAIDIVGGLAYIADGDSGLQIIDVSNPAAPRLLGSCDTSGFARDVQVQGNFAYVVDSAGGLQIINVSNSSQPTLIGSYLTPNQANGVYVSGGVAFIACNQPAGLQIVDVGNPSTPVPIASCSSFNGHAWDVSVAGGLAYMGYGAFDPWGGYYYGGLSVIDVADPSHPVMRSWCNAGQVERVFLSGQLVYIAVKGLSGSGLGVIDVSDPSQPVSQGWYSFSPSGSVGVYVSGGAAYVTDGYGGLWIFRYTGKGTLEGYIRDSVTGNPLASALISLGVKNAQSNAQGFYSISDITPGTYTGTVTKDGYYSESKEVIIGDNETKVLNFSLRPIVTSENPVVTSVRPQYTGFFIGGIDLSNEYKVYVDWKDSPGVVKFNLNGTEVTETGQSWGASHTYNMGNDFIAIPPFGYNTNILKIKAVNNEGKESQEYKLYPIVISNNVLGIPISGFIGVVYLNDIIYKIDVKFPVPPWKAMMEVDKLPSVVRALWSLVPFFGGSDLGIGETQVFLFGEYSTTGEGKAGIGGQTEFKMMGQGAGGSISGGGAFKYVSQNSSVNWEDVFIKLKLYGIFYKKVGIVTVIPALSELGNVPGISWFNERAKVEGEFKPGFEFELKAKVDNGKLDFDSFEASGEIGSEVTLSLEICDWIEASLYGGGTPKLIVGIPEPYFRNLMLSLLFGLKIEIWLFELNPEAEFEFTWPNPPSGKDYFKMESFPPKGGFKVASRDYLKKGTYSRFVANESKTLEDFKKPSIESITEEFKIIEGVYPRSEPTITERSGKVLVTFVYDDPNDLDLQNTEIEYSYFDGSVWSTPVPILNDTRAEFNPQVKFDKNGNGLAVWERVKNENFTSTELVDMAKEMEIVYSIFNLSTKQWSTPQPLTNNSYLDYNPLLSKNKSGDLMLVWLSNKENLFIGDDSNLPNSATEIHYAIWDGSSWIKQGIVASNLTYAFKFNIAFTGISKGIIVYTQDMDKNLSTLDDEEIYYIRYDNSAWGAPLRLTNNSINDSSPKAIYDSASTTVIIWDRNKEIVMKYGLVAGEPTLVRANSDSITLTDFRLGINSSNNIVMLWQGQSDTGADMYYTVYDKTHNVWGKDNKLVGDQPLEKYFNGEFGANGELYLIYNKELIVYEDRIVEIQGESVTVKNVPKPDRNDLYILRHKITDDLYINSSDITLSNPNPKEGETVTIQASVHNGGDTGIQNLEAGFYDGDPDSGGTLIDVIKTIANIIPANGQDTVSVDWLVPGGDSAHNIYCKVDPDNKIEEFDENNNKASIKTVLPDLAVISTSSEYIANGKVNVLATVKNLGSITSGSSNIKFLMGSENGTLLLSNPINSLKSDETVTYQQEFDPSGWSFSDGNVIIYIVVNSEKTFEEPDYENNAKPLVIYKNRDAKIVSYDIPSKVIVNNDVNFNITVKNTGMESWSKAGGYKINSVNSDPFNATGFELDDFENVEYGGTKVFNLIGKAPSTTQTFMSSWQMTKTDSGYFGEQLNQEVTVSDSTSANNWEIHE